jgi:hypothetical protein
VLPDLAAGVGGVCVDRGVARRCKGFGGGVGDCEGDELAAVPVSKKSVTNEMLGGCALVGWSVANVPITSIIPIAIDKRDFDPTVQQESQILEPAVPGIIAYTPESSTNSPRTLRPVQRNPHLPLHPLLIEETLVKRRRSRRRIQRSNIVIIPPAVKNIRVQHITPAETLRGLADIIHSRVDPEGFRISYGCCFTAVDDLIATGARVLKGSGHVEVLGLVYGLDAVGVVVGHCRVGGPLDEAVDAAVDYHESVDVEEGVFAVVVGEGAVGDLLVLFFEVGGEGGAVAAAL